MDKYKIWTSIVGTGLIASVTAAASFFPDLKIILVAVSGLISAIMAFITSRK